MGSMAANCDSLCDAKLRPRNDRLPIIMPGLRDLRFRARFRRFAAILALADARALAAPSAQIIELGAPHLALAHHLNGIDEGRIDREYALDSFARSEERRVGKEC